MGIRETMNERPRTAAVAAGLVVVAAIAFLISSMSGGPSADAGAPPSRAFFSDDDGKTYFADDIAKAPGFLRNGKPTLKAYVYSANGKPFVAYLERLTPEAQAACAALNKGKSPDPKVLRTIAEGSEVKRPGDARWIRRSAGEASTIIYNVRAPDGKAAEVTQVTP